MRLRSGGVESAMGTLCGYRGMCVPIMDGTSARVNGADSGGNGEQDGHLSAVL